MTLRAGKNVVIKPDVWVYSQTPSQLIMDRWTKVMIIKPVNAQIESLGSDGWLILIADASKIKYKVWHMALESDDGQA